MSSLTMTIERAARAACFLCHFGLYSTAIILESIIRPALPMFDEIFENHFSQNYKLRHAGEFLIKNFSKKMFEVLGINVISEFKVKSHMKLISYSLRLKFQKVTMKT